jgi:hypothetical protein
MKGSDDLDGTLRHDVEYLEHRASNKNVLLHSDYNASDVTHTALLAFPWKLRPPPGALRKEEIAKLYLHTQGKVDSRSLCNSLLNICPHCVLFGLQLFRQLTPKIFTASNLPNLQVEDAELAKAFTLG